MEYYFNRKLYNCEDKSLDVTYLIRDNIIGLNTTVWLDTIKINELKIVDLNNDDLLNILTNLKEIMVEIKKSEELGNINFSESFSFFIENNILYSCYKMNEKPNYVFVNAFDLDNRKHNVEYDFYTSISSNQLEDNSLIIKSGNNIIVNEKYNDYIMSTLKKNFNIEKPLMEFEITKDYGDYIDLYVI